jgi:Acetyltransferase (GNAT) domain
MGSRTEAPSPPAYEARRLSLPDDGVRWEEFVRASREAHPFATLAWLEGAAEATGAGFDLWAVTKGEEWIAAAAVTYRTRAGLRVHFGPPLAAYSPIVYRRIESTTPWSKSTEHARATAALAEALSGAYRSLSFLLPPSIDDVRPFTWAHWDARPRYTYVLDVTRELPVADSVRRHLRKCRESGCTLSTDWDFDRFWEVFDETRKRQQFGIRLDRETFRRLAERLHHAGVAWMVSGMLGGQMASSQIVLSIPGTAGAFMWTAGTRQEALSSGVSAWLMVEIAAEVRRRGHSTWDLCGADFPSVARFKSELGGTLEHYFQIDAPRSGVERAVRWARSLVGPRNRS